MNIKHFIGLLGVTLFVVLGLAFTSCSSSSDDPEPTMSVNGSASIEADGTVVGDITVTAENLKMIIKYKFWNLNFSFCFLTYTSNKYKIPKQFKREKNPITHG